MNTQKATKKVAYSPLNVEIFFYFLTLIVSLVILLFTNIF
jgi:hypothetical protein